MKFDEVLYKYLAFPLSKASGLPPAVIENCISSALLATVYFIFAPMIRGFFKSRLSGDKYHDIVDEALPKLLRYAALILLAHIWLTGEGSLASFLSLSPLIVNKIVATIYVYLFYVAIRIIAHAIVSLNDKLDVQKQYSIGRTIQLVSGVILALLLFRIWVASTADLSTYLGLLSAGLAIALQDVIVSAVGWIYLITVKPFNIGDRVQIGDSRGDVTDIKLFQFSLLENGNWVNADQATGRILHFPNSFIFKNVISNYHTGFDYIWTEMPVLITFESDWKRAYEILDAILEEHVGRRNERAIRQIRRASRHMRLSFSQIDSAVIESVQDSGVCLTLRFLCSIRKRRKVESQMWRAILEAFSQEPHIDFAYPTQRFYTNASEGKRPYTPSKSPSPETSV